MLSQLPEPVASARGEGRSCTHRSPRRSCGAWPTGELRADLDIRWTLRTIGALYELAMQALAAGNVTREEAVQLMASSLLQGALAR